MTKLEVIEKAYGKNYEEMKEFIDENGWLTEMHTSIHYRTTENGKTLNKLIEKANISFEEVNNFLRPVTISGIENNNGWIKIESEADLPDKTEPNSEVKYHVLAKEGFEDLSDCNSFELHHMYKNYHVITHYIPVIILPKPLY